MARTLLLLACAIAGLVTIPTDAQEVAPVASTASMGEADAPVPVPPPTAEALEYHRTGNWVWVVQTLWGLAVPAVILFTGLSGLMRRLAERIGRRWILVVGLYVALYSAVDFVASFPLAYYADFLRPHAYGLSNQSFETWLRESFLSLAIGVVVGGLFALLLYGFLRRSPRRWWLWTSIALVPCLFFGMLVAPIWIAPLFDDFGPMEDQALEGEILALAERASIDGGRVLEVDKSEDTDAVNAYVSGFGATKRIVLWDTIVDKLSREELLFVMGHEMGHYVLGHVTKSILFLAVILGLGLFVVHRTAGGLIARFGPRFGFDRLDDVASLPLLLLLLSVAVFALLPLVLGYSRYQEREADRFGLELTRANRAAAQAFVKLQQENLAVPHPGQLYTLWRGSHPALGQRIEFCNAYRPWAEGRPLVYGDRFRAP